MLLGQKDLTMDDKGRLLMTSIYRNEFEGGQCYASIGFDHCIVLYPSKIYEAQVSRMLQLNDFDPVARDVKRTFLSNTFQLDIDSHNRILLPKPLLEKFGITKKVTVVGVGDHLELWDTDAFREKSTRSESNYSTDAQSLRDR